MQNKIPKNLKIPKRNENFLFGIFLYNCIVLVYNTKEKFKNKAKFKFKDRNKFKIKLSLFILVKIKSYKLHPII